MAETIRPSGRINKYLDQGEQVLDHLKTGIFLQGVDYYMTDKRVFRLQNFQWLNLIIGIIIWVVVGLCYHSSIEGGWWFFYGAGGVIYIIIQIAVSFKQQDLEVGLANFHKSDFRSSHPAGRVLLGIIVTLVLVGLGLIYTVADAEGEFTYIGWISFCLAAGVFIFFCVIRRTFCLLQFDNPTLAVWKIELPLVGTPRGKIRQFVQNVEKNARPGGPA